LSECIQESMNKPEDDYSTLIRKIMKSFPKSSIDFIVTSVKESFLAEKYLDGCIILHLTNNFESESLEAVSRFVEEGIIDQLLKIFENENINITYILFEFFSVICIFLIELKREQVVQIVLNKFMKVIRMINYPNFSSNSMFNIIFTITKLSNFNQKVDLSQLDFRELLEFVLNNEDSSFLLFTSSLINCNQNPDQIDKNLIKRVVDRSIEIINSDQVGRLPNPYSHFKIFVKFLKYDFRPWMVESIKICFEKLQDLLVEPDESDNTHDLDVFTILKMLIALFREDCEIYISKYKIVPLMIQFVNLEVDEVRFHFEIQF
jgi:hypothetical protein